MVPDYYDRLRVHPGADRSEIEAALARMQPSWSMGTRNPKTRHANQLFLDEIPALRRALLSDPASRAAYDAELAVAQMAERERKLDELQRRVRLRAAKGGLGPSDRGLLGDLAVKLGLGQDDLNRIIRPIPSLNEAHADGSDLELDHDPPADVLDPSTRRQIRVALEHLGCRDLYDALGVARDAPATYISARADEERQRWMKKAQVTAEKTAWLEIITHAQSHLTSSKARARYDRTLALEAEEAFDTVAAFTLNGLGRLDPGTHAALIDEAAALSIPAERADRLLHRICRRLDIARAGGHVAAATPLGSHPASPIVSASVNGSPRFSLMRCRHCAGVTEMSPVARKAAAARCRHCGASLKWACPGCRQSHWVDEARCACGFRMALREPVVRHFEAAQQAFRSFDLTGALAHLARIEELAPNLPGARNGIARVRQRQSEIARLKLAFEAARAGGRLAAASAAVEAWSRLVDPESPEVQSAQDGLVPPLRRAEALAAKARNLERTDPPAARNFYLQSLSIAADLPDALAGLARTPPDPPTNLEAQVLGDRIRLVWRPPQPDGLGPLTFIVLRKRHGALQHPADGTRIAEVSTPEFDDTHVPPGETVGYAVMSKRAAIESVAAISLGPLVFLADVKDVRVEFRQHEVELAWRPPRGTAEVRVVRKQGAPPTDPRDGVRLAAALDHALDRNLAQDEVYHYGIYAIYKMSDGRLFPSLGVVVAARPQPPVAPLDAPRLWQEPSGRVRIDWVEPVRGSVRVLRTDSPIPHPAGVRLTDAELKSLAGEWLEPCAPDRAYDPTPPPANVCFYTPMTVWSDTWTVGHSTALSRVEDPSELSASRAGSGLGASRSGIRVILRWRWPAAATGAVIAARQGAPPAGPADPLATTTEIDRAEYNRQDCWTLSLPAGPTWAGTAPAMARQSSPPASDPAQPDGGPWSIRVFSIADHDGARSFSPGMEPTAATSLAARHAEVTVSYVLKRPWLPGLPWSLSFRTYPSGRLLSPMVLVANPRTVPLSVDDGQIVARLPAIRDGARFPIRTAVNLHRHEVRVFPDPAVEPDALVPIRFRHPETGSTRV
jgi:hypothetical protein